MLQSGCGHSWILCFRSSGAIISLAGSDKIKFSSLLALALDDLTVVCDLAFSLFLPLVWVENKRVESFRKGWYVEDVDVSFDGVVFLEVEAAHSPELDDIVDGE